MSSMYLYVQRYRYSILSSTLVMWGTCSSVSALERTEAKKSLEARIDSPRQCKREDNCGNPPLKSFSRYCWHGCDLYEGRKLHYLSCCACVSFRPTAFFSYILASGLYQASPLDRPPLFDKAVCVSKLFVWMATFAQFSFRLTFTSLMTAFDKRHLYRRQDPDGLVCRKK